MPGRIRYRVDASEQYVRTFIVGVAGVLEDMDAVTSWTTKETVLLAYRRFFIFKMIKVPRIRIIISVVSNL